MSSHSQLAQTQGFDSFSHETGCFLCVNWISDIVFDGGM